MDSELKLEFCSTCLKIATEDDKFVKLSFTPPEEISLNAKLQFCVPEMVLERTEECFLCKPCSAALETAYTFRCMCLKTAKKLKEFKSAQGRRSDSDVINNKMNRESIQNERDNVNENLQDGLIKNVEGRLLNNSNTVPCKENVLQSDQSSECGDDNKDSNLDSYLTDPEKVRDELGNLLTESLATISQSSVTNKFADFKSRKKQKLILKKTEKGKSDEDILKASCANIPELQHCSPKSLKCKVILEKAVLKELQLKQKRLHYGCVVCDKDFNTKHQLINHVLQHLNNRPFKCRKCPSRFTSRDALMKHRRRTHNEMRDLRNDPDLCNMVVRANEIVVNYLKSKGFTYDTIIRNNMNNKLKLPVNNYKKVYNREMNRERKKLTAEYKLNDNVYRCSKCDYFAYHKHKLKYHYRNHKDIKPLECSVCSKGFRQKKQLKRHKLKSACRLELRLKTTHTNSLTNDKPFECSNCFKRFLTIQQFKRHKQETLCRLVEEPETPKIHTNTQTNSNDKPFQCSKCSKIFLTMHQLNRHKRETLCRLIKSNTKKRGNVKSSKRYRDKVAFHRLESKTEMQTKASKKEFVNKTDYTEHKQTHTIIFDCSKCSKSFLNQQQLQDHQQECCPMQTSNMNCEICQKEFDNKTMYSAHKEMHLKPFECSNCSKRFFEECQLRRHKRDTLCSVAFKTKSATCEICQEEFVNEAEYLEHEKSHAVVTQLEQSTAATDLSEQKNAKKYCDICQKEFDNDAMYSAHKETHLKPFECSNCSKRFLEECQLRRHKRDTLCSVAFQTKSLTCEICQEKFVNEAEYLEHKKSHAVVTQLEQSTATTDLSEQKKAKKYYCEICNKETGNKDHKNVHTGEQPYKCQICKRQFSASSSLSRHRLLHLKNKRNIKAIKKKNKTKKQKLKNRIKLNVSSCEISKEKFTEEAQKHEFCNSTENNIEESQNKNCNEQIQEPLDVNQSIESDKTILEEDFCVKEEFIIEEPVLESYEFGDDDVFVDTEELQLNDIGDF